MKYSKILLAYNGSQEGKRALFETADLAGLQERLRTHKARFAGDPGQPERPNLFIHPSSLHGMLMGVSRTNFAWAWSGRPELARAGG